MAFVLSKIMVNCHTPSCIPWALLVPGWQDTTLLISFTLLGALSDLVEVELVWTLLLTALLVTHDLFGNIT